MLKRKRYSAKFKSEVALEALKEQGTFGGLIEPFWASYQPNFFVEKTAFGGQLGNFFGTQKSS